MEDTKPSVIFENAAAKPKKLSASIISKIIFIFLGLIIVFELIWAAKSLVSSTPIIKVKQIQALDSGRIVLNSPKTTFSVGEIVPVEIRIVTGGKEVDSVDLILHFDPNILEASVSTSFKKGEIYQDYPLVDISKEGVVRISAISDPNKRGLVGIGSFGVLYFKAKAIGATELSVEFQKGVTTDSNLVEARTSQDILKEVFNLKLNIGNTTSKPQNKTDTCKGYTQYCQAEGGKTGIQVCSEGKISGESCIFDPESTNNCSVCQIVP